MKQKKKTPTGMTADTDRQSPGEIKRREVSWTLTRTLDAFAGPGEIKRREVVVDPQVDQEQGGRSGLESWISFASVVSQRRSYGHCLCDCSA